ncbi:unnamed protein product [Schistosoma turkestanicum]|nr:unnamed protein product [Schistosoma turkestanicum]
MGKCGTTIQSWFLAIEKGDLSLVQKLWKDINDIDVTDNYILNNIKHENVTGLIVGAYYGHKDIVRWLLKNKANANWETNLKWRPIHFAAKRGHCATVDMLCSSGAAVDPVTMNNETPLSLAIQSHMRDTVRKLVHLGAKTSKSNEGIIYHYVCPGMLVSDNSAPGPRDSIDSFRDKNSQLQNQNARTNSSILPVISTSCLDDDLKKFSVAIFDSQIIMNQLQCQSTSYDLELARRKRELIRRLPLLPCISLQSANQFLQLIQRASRADLPLDSRLLAVSNLFDLLLVSPVNDVHNDLSNKTPNSAFNEPYLRLIEACLCETHCPLELTVQLSRLAVHMASLGINKPIDVNGSVASDDLTPKSSTPSSHVISYILKLLRKLVLKGNPQYRSGILAHLSRILSDLYAPASDGKEYNISNLCSWNDLIPYSSSVMSSLIRLGESLDQPLNVPRFAQLVGLIARCLISVFSRSSSSSFSARFSDLADILVGWSVDSSGTSKDVNINTIYEELYFGLSHWFLMSTEEKVDECKQTSLSPIINENIREMIAHLLEDSENSLNTAISECAIVNCKRGTPISGSVKQASDPNSHFVSVQLYLNVLCSIFGGICKHAFESTQLCFNDVMSGNVSQWIERLLHIIQSTSAYYNSLISQKQTGPWHSGHGNVSNPRIPLTVLDGIQSSVFKLLNCLIQFSDCSKVDLIAVDNCVISTVDAGSLPNTNCSLSSLLELIFTVLKIKHSSTFTSANPSSLLKYFDSHSKLHHFKFCCRSTNERESSPSQKMFRMLCYISSTLHLQSAVCELALSDLQLAIGSQKHSDTSASHNRKAEILGLFSLSLLTEAMKNLSCELKNELLYRVFDIIQPNCSENWHYFSPRLRIILLSFMNNSSLVKRFQPVYICHMITSFLSVKCISNIECFLLFNLTDLFLSEGILNPDDQISLIFNLITLSKRMLLTQIVLDSINNVFTLVVNVLMKHTLLHMEKGNANLASHLLHLSQISLSYPCSQVQKAGNDLLLFIGSFSLCKAEFPATCLYSELLWFTTRRPDQSATALLPVSNINDSDGSHNNLLTMTTAFPSLPAVAGILGILTRGAPYTQKVESSRLKILKSPFDWIRRLSCLVSPLPSDKKQDLSLLQCTSFIQPVLWHTAWAMVDYKLKVAPWANPLKTFFSLEGTLRAFIQPISSNDSSNNNQPSIISFHVASSEALSHQKKNRHLSQIHLLLNFLNYLERVIFNATNGLAIAVSRPSKSASIFFTANENTCTQWFNRIRILLVRISNDLPLMSCSGIGPANEVLSTTVYHAYSLLKIVSNCNSINVQDIWISTLKQYGDPTDLFIYLSKALHHLGAWEELKALAQWTDDLFTAEQNPFSWLHGISSLTRGRWDQGILQLTSFLDSNLQKNKTLTSENLTTDETEKLSVQTSVTYVTNVLLQMYLSEGNYSRAHKLRNRITSCVKMKSLKENSMFQLNSARLNCLSKLSEWVSENGVEDNLTSNSAELWSQRCLQKQLDNLLVSAASVKHHSCGDTEDESSTKCLLELTKIIRQKSANTTFLLPLNLFADFYSQSSYVLDDGLQDYLIKAEFLINERSCTTYGAASPVHFSSWVHLISSDMKTHSVAEFSACQWACLNNCPHLAQRLLVKTAKCLTLLDTSEDEEATYFDKLCNIALSSSHDITSKLSRLDTLKFYNCMARILWLSGNGKDERELISKTKAITMLTSGLKSGLMGENICDTIKTASQSSLEAEMALSLFDWLESPTSTNDISMAEKIYQSFISTSDPGGKSQDFSRIASDLELFSCLSDVSWCNGVPEITQPFQSTNSSPGSSTSWTNRLLMMATHLSSNGSSASVWLKLANWCYLRGHKEIHEFQSAARNFNKVSNEKTSHHPSVPVLLKLVQPQEYASLTILAEKLFSSPLEHSSDDGQEFDMSITSLISALTTFLASDRFDEDDSELFRHHSDLPVHLHQFSSQCPDDPMDSQMQQKFFSHLRNLIPSLSEPNLSSDSIKLLHQLLVSITERQHTLHMSAAQAYATFLTIADQSRGSRNSIFYKPITKLDITTATLKFLDLLCSPSRKLRSMISGFLDQASPVLLESNQSMNVQSDRLQCGSGSKSSPTLGGPTIWEACLPQVLIRLGLPDDMIRNCLVALLNRLIYIGTDHNVNFKWNSPSFRLAAQLVFPSVVAASDPVNPDKNIPGIGCKETISGTTDNLDLTSSTDAPILQSDSKPNPSYSFSKIVIALRNAGLSDLVHQVELFTFELQRITVLWEELWLGSLVQHLDELSKKINLLESELKRTEKIDVYQTVDNSKDLSMRVSSKHIIIEKENASLLSHDIDTNNTCFTSLTNVEDDLSESKNFAESIDLAKYFSALQPTLDLLSQLYSLTILVTPETPHEEWFQKTFGHVINELQESLLHPVDFRDAKEPVSLIRQLIHQLQTTRQSTTFSQIPVVSRVGAAPEIDIRQSINNLSYLNLRQLSPRLCSLHFENDHSISPTGSFACGIPLPGHLGIGASYLGSRITVLPTKTRPKRLLLRAQNGRTYPYLLKGLEDLRLDDRIMRLFELTSLAAVELSSINSRHFENTFARTYSVTPLGVRSGLLQMVQGAVPLFSLYKKWQLRNYKSSSSNGCISSTSVIPRPGELFHTRLKELLHAAGQHYQSQSRSNWPIDVLREVLITLEAETPPDLLTRELWASNPSCASWWRVTRTFAKSAGLLSSLGYLVGLGDRHLDNLLIDLSTGHIVHIDYNVCFDKGKSLRVAEKVPFRLTRILRHALGPACQDTLVRGTFRFSAEAGLHAARHIVDPLLIQLKAFLIDPLADWQQKKHPSSNSQIVTDFIHLAAFHGGGSTNSCNYQTVSTYRRLRRVDSELRMYSGLLTLRLVDLIQSTCLNSVFSSLDSVLSRLTVWTELTKARQHSSFINNRYLTLKTATHSDLSSSEYHCQQVEKAKQTIHDLHEEFSKQNKIWIDEILSHFQNYKSLVDPTWLSSIISSNEDVNSPLCVALSNYYTVARIYLTTPEFIDSLSKWVNQLKCFHSQIDSSMKSNNIDSLMNLLSSDIPLYTCDSDPKLSIVLEQSAKKSFHHLCELRRIKEENVNSHYDYANPESTILHEINNLNLFVFDQGAAGVTAYCWALLDYVLSVSGNSLAIEMEFKEWDLNSSNCQTDTTHFKSLPLDQLGTCTDCLLNLFSVLRHQSTGTWNFNAGFESDVRRELAFLIAVRDSVCCITQLRANLLRLLVPEAIESLITASISMVENFSKFVVQNMTKPTISNLKQLVDNFLLKDFIIENQGDAQLHHVLVAVHLALTNTTAQLEEISVRISSCTITALAWYYVDIISQVTTVLMSKSSNCSEGAASLWKWEPNLSNSIPDNITSCSWTDEVYNAGIMAFVTTLENGLTHWQTIRRGCTDKIELTPKLFIDPIDNFIGRLSSRLGLSSLVGLASSRLFCALVENTGLSIHRLLIEGELSAKASGLVSVVSLSAEKLIESVNVQISLTQPVSVQHLRTPACNLIHRLVNRSSQISQCLEETFEIEAAERHYKHLVLSVSAYNWMHTIQIQEKSQLYQQDPCVYLTNTLSSIKDAAELEGASDENTSEISANTVARSIYYIETLRSSGLSSSSSFSRCVNIASELLKAIELKEKLISEFNELDWIVYTVKDTYALKWPVHGWFQSSSNSDSGEVLESDVLELIKSDLTSAELAVNKLSQQLSFIKEEFNEMYLKSESLNDVSCNRSLLPVVISKKANRNPQSCRSTALSTLQHTVSVSLCPSEASANAKQPTMIASLRFQLSTLQKEKFSDIRQIVKILSRYNAVRFNLLHSDHISVSETCSASIWSTWLDGHQNWTTNVSSVLKRLTKFISSFSPSVKSYASGSCVPSEEETEFATSLSQDCLLVKFKLVEVLIKPLVDGIYENVSSNPHLYHSLEGFLEMLNAHFKNVKETMLVQMKESGVEITEPKPTQKVEKVIFSGRSLNMSALSVWNRIYDRLHGFDSFLPTANTNQSMSINAQIDACIHEATNVDNLALMYEGWTAWV